jgi:hypothetical protein
VEDARSHASYVPRLRACFGSATYLTNRSQPPSRAGQAVKFSDNRIPPRELAKRRPTLRQLVWWQSVSTITVNLDQHVGRASATGSSRGGVVGAAQRLKFPFARSLGGRVARLRGTLTPPPPELRLSSVGALIYFAIM